MHLVDLTSGAALGTVSQTSTATFSLDGTRLILVSTTGALSELGAIKPSVAAPAIPSAVSDSANQFVAAQVADDTSALHRLAAASVDVTVPRHLSRAYVVAISGGTAEFVAQAHLVVDPSSSSSNALAADETITLSVDASGDYVVSALQVSAFAAQSPGPHVIRAGYTNDQSVIQLAFDADLDPTTLRQAISLTEAGAPVASNLTYDAGTKTVTITLLSHASTGLTLSISPALQDIGGETLAQPFSLNLAS